MSKNHEIVAVANTLRTNISLADWHNQKNIRYLWIVGVGCPAGQDFRHDTEADGEDYCDFAEMDLLSSLWELTGTVDESGMWCWDGIGEVRDDFGNTIHNVKARR